MFDTCQLFRFQLMVGLLQLNVWTCVIFAGINVSLCTGKTLLKSNVIGIFGIEFIFLQNPFSRTAAGCFSCVPILHK